MKSSIKREVHNVSLDRATVIGNVREKCGEDRTCSSEDMIADGQSQTDRHAHHNTTSLCVHNFPFVFL